MYTVDANGCAHPGIDGHKCSSCGMLKGIAVTVPHNSADEWSSDGDNHWHQRTVCGDKTDVAGHTHDNACDTDCNVCGHEREPLVLWGDINDNGLIDSFDAATILRYDIGVITLTESQLAAADVNGDGCVDSADATVILKYDVGLLDRI